MKRLCIFWTFFVLISVNISTQETYNLKSENTGQNNVIIIDLFPMVPGANGYEFGEGIGLGIMYERRIHPYFSILGGGTFNTNFEDKLSYSFSSRFRIYPFKTAIRNLFTDAAIVYTRDINETKNVQTLSGMFSIGWNFIFENGLVLVPGAFYRHKIMDITEEKPYKFGFGLIMGIGLVF
jgi:hypothetical protein